MPIAKLMLHTVKAGHHPTAALSKHTLMLRMQECMRAPTTTPRDSARNVSARWQPLRDQGG